MSLKLKEKYKEKSNKSVHSLSIRLQHHNTKELSLILGLLWTHPSTYQIYSIPTKHRKIRGIAS